MVGLLDLCSKKELAKLLIDKTPVAYIILDNQYRIVYVNESFAKLRQLDMEKVIGNKCYNISNGGNPCTTCAVRQTLSTGEKAFVSRKDTLPDGSVRFIDDYSIPLQKNPKGEVEYVLEIMINRTTEMVARERRNTDYDEILSVLSNLLEEKDRYTATHSDSVRKLSLNLATAMGLSSDEIFEITIAASLHDIGKVKIPDMIINKPSRLDEDEYELIKTHSIHSYDMLDGMVSFDNIRNIARHHHECPDGTGYPDGLSGNDISIGSRIIAVADTYDAITSTRSYRTALSHEYAVEEIKRVAGKQLDASVVEAFLELPFDHLSEKLYGSEQFEENSSIERDLHNQAQSKNKEDQEQNIGEALDLEVLFEEMIRNTPCGYLVLDKERNVLYASDYFLRYMNLTKEQILGNTCYKAGGIGSVPCAQCPIQDAMASGKVEYVRKEQMTPAGYKVFDLFGVPLSNEDDQDVEYVIEIIIDRTEEVLMERAREKDFKTLIHKLQKNLESQDNEWDKEKLLQNIDSLTKHMQEFVKK